MTGSVSSTRASTLWIVLLTTASTATTLALACATPFPSLAALAALHLRRRDGLLLMLLAWLASQAVGFGVLGYPHDLKTLTWGLGLATAAMGAGHGAYATLAVMRDVPFAVRLVAGYIAAFSAFKLVVLLWSFVLGGVAIALSPVASARPVRSQRRDPAWLARALSCADSDRAARGACGPGAAGMNARSAPGWRKAAPC